MLASYKLLSKFVNLDGITPEEIEHKLTFAGLEVEGIEKLAYATNLVIGEIVKVENHPDSDHLHILQVNEGDKYGIEQIVCGAPNVKVGLKVIVARIGATLGKDNFLIKKSTIRGVESNGMCCALNELGVDKQYLTQEQINGIEELPSDAIVGNENVLEYLGLDDVIFDINVLANRSDVLAIYSLAKELSALFDRELTIEEPKLFQENDTDIICSSECEECPQFSIKVVRDVVTKESPIWLKQYLRSQGIRSINNIVDIGNYVMILTGQPLHMYDLDKLKSNKFVVKNNVESKIVCLDDKTYDVIPGDIVVTNDDEIVCLAGIMGLKSVAVDENTKNIAIESANFRGSSIRKTSTRIGLSSDSSAHFLKGINPKQDEFVLYLAAQLLVELADAKIVEKNSRYSTISMEKNPIECSITYINKRLGTEFDYQTITSILKKLQIEIIDVDHDKFIALPPHHRIDLQCNADLSEEIIRFVGFDAIKSKLPLMVTTVGGYSPEQQKRFKLRNFLIDLGLNEALTYTLISPKENEEFVLLNNDQPYQIYNPMTIDHSVVRRGLVKSLLNVIEYNISHQQHDLSFFEVSDIITKSSYYQELCVVLNGSKSLQGQMKKDNYDFYDIHGIMESIFALFGINKNRYKEERLTDSKYYHPGRSTKISIGNKVIGVCGQIHPLLSKDIGETYVLELNLTELFNLKVPQTRMSQISKYPMVNRDLALVVEKDILAEDIIKTIKKFGKSIVKNVEIFDVYQGEHLKDGYKSVAISISFQDDAKTLVEKDINDSIDSIMNGLFKVLKAELRK